MDPTEPESGCFAAGEGWRGEALDTARLRLRRLVPGDAPALVAALADGRVAGTTARIPHPFGPAEAEAWLARVAGEVARGAAWVFALERRTDGALIGAIGLEAHAEGEAELGYWIAAGEWGRGYATEAVRRMLRLAFRNLKLPAVRAAALLDNPASARVLAKAGFAESGRGTISLPARGRDGAARLFRLAAAAWAAQDRAKPTLLVAAVAMVDIDGRVLLARRPVGKPLAGLWEFPGGKVAPGETPEMALVRELEEELGVDVRESCLAALAFASHDYDTFHLLMPLYLCRMWKGAPSPREGQELAWVRPVRMRDYPMPPADLPLVALLRDWL